MMCRVKWELLNCHHGGMLLALGIILFAVMALAQQKKKQSEKEVC